MKKKYLLLSFVIICALGIISTTNVNSHIVFPPAGYCGDPTAIPPYVTCASSGCHGGNAQAVTAQNLNVQIGTDSNALVALDTSFKYVPSQTYYISFSVLLGGYVQGFEMTALNPNTAMAGSFTKLNIQTEHISPGPPFYISHLHAVHGVSRWLYQWTAPATDSAVTFYYAFNSGDSADFYGGPIGAGIPDSNIYVGQTTITHAFGAGIENIANNISALMVYPNPVEGVLGLSFDVLKAGNASALLYSIDGKLCRPLFNEKLGSGSFNRSFDMSEFAAGIYFVKLNVGGAAVTRKIIIQ